jgi:hypothetical protein
MRGYELNSNCIVIEFEHEDSFTRIAEVSEFGKVVVAVALEQYRIPNNLEKSAVVIKHDDDSGLMEISPLVSKSYDPKQKRYLWEPPTKDYPEAFKRRLVLPEGKAEELMKEYYQQEEAIHQKEEPGAPPLTKKELEKIEMEASKFPAGPPDQPGAWESSIGGEKEQEERQFEFVMQTKKREEFVNNKLNYLLKQKNVAIEDLTEEELAEYKNALRREFYLNFILLSAADGHMHRLKNLKRETDGSITHSVVDLETGDVVTLPERDFNNTFKVFSAHQPVYDLKITTLRKKGLSQVAPTQTEIEKEDVKDLNKIIKDRFNMYLTRHDLNKEDLTTEEKKQIKDSIKKEVEKELEEVEIPEKLEEKTEKPLPEESEEVKKIDVTVPEKIKKERQTYLDQTPRNEKIYDEAIAEANRYEKAKGTSMPERKFKKILEGLVGDTKDIDPKIFWKWYDKEKSFEHADEESSELEASAFTKDEMIKLGFSSEILLNLQDKIDTELRTAEPNNRIFLNRWADDIFIVSTKPFQRTLFTIKNATVKKPQVNSLYKMSFEQELKLKELGFSI